MNASRPHTRRAVLECCRRFTVGRVSSIFLFIPGDRRIKHETHAGYQTAAATFAPEPAQSIASALTWRYVLFYHRSARMWQFDFGEKTPMKKYDITALGELLIDFVSVSSECPKTADDALTYEANPGGAPANLICVPAKYGMRTAFIGKVGADPFGRRLVSVLENQGVDTSGIITDPNVFTTLAFVELDKGGKPSFTFARKPGSDTMLREDELPMDILENTRLLHFSGLCLTDEPARSAAAAAIHAARKAGAFITFDANYRPDVWPDPVTAREQILNGIKEADIAKLSKEDLAFLGVEPMDLLHTYSSHFIFMTLGDAGCMYVGRDGEGFVQGIRQTGIVDTTGAGDIFFGAALYRLLQIDRPLTELSHEELEQILRFANEKAAASLCRRGGIPSIPEL